MHNAQENNASSPDEDRTPGSYSSMEHEQAKISPGRIKDEIEKRVAERTAELRNAKNEAERAYDTQFEFLSRMSHGLRTPLNGILGYAQLLMYNSIHALDGEQTEYVQEILRSGNNLLSLINEVHDLSCIENGQLELAAESVAIAQLVRESAAQMKALAGKRNIKICVNLVGDYVIRVDRLRMRQILLHLLSNAVKYNRDGGSINIRCSSASAGRVLIEVEDSGCGIAADSIQRLFQPFARLHSASGGMDGSGIGLALARRLTEAMGGKIGVDSIAGSGSNFWLEFPLEEGVGVEPLPDLIAMKIAGNSQLCVLYIEDNPSSVRLVEESISSRLGISLIHAPTAELGLEISLFRCPDIILLDINLPGMDGFDALALLKNDPVTRQIPVIAITANAMERDIKRGLDAGFADYLTKPLDIIQLIILLEKFLERKKANGLLK